MPSTLLWVSPQASSSNLSLAPIGATIRGKGLTYSDFESAMPYYKQSGLVQGDTEDIKEFNDIMEFLYMGRRERELLCSSIDDVTTVLDVMETSK